MSERQLRAWKKAVSAGVLCLLGIVYTAVYHTDKNSWTEQRAS